MKKLFFSIYALIFLVIQVAGQQTWTLKGRVSEEKNKPLPGASVNLFPGTTGTATGDRGFFEFRNLPEGKYSIEISYVGYQKYQAEIDLTENRELNIRLKPRLQTLQEVVITDNYAEQRHREESLNVEIVND
ncbi:MAG: carboxypeptidase-like regulatory domain-containing protein, partial [Bacteroidales bacterium]|nr:carboxypeptidase-like regulatory domain-containing protein [Bacteroidales bacterium]